MGYKEGVKLEQLPDEERLKGLSFSAWSRNGFRGIKQQPESTKDVTKKVKLGSLLRCTAGEYKTIAIKLNREALT